MDPIPTPTSISRKPATSGPPNTAETAEAAPAVPTTRSPWSPRRMNGVTASPTTEPSAMSGASGPRTAPKPSVPRAASATPGPAASRVGEALSPSIGSWPPSPGRKRRAITTTTAPATGRNTTRYQGGEECPSWSGRSCHSHSCSLVTSPRKSTATRAAGIPMIALIRIRRR